MKNDIDKLNDLMLVVPDKEDFTPKIEDQMTQYIWSMDWGYTKYYNLIKDTKIKTFENIDILPINSALLCYPVDDFNKKIYTEQKNYKIHCQSMDKIQKYLDDKSLKFVFKHETVAPSSVKAPLSEGNFDNIIATKMFELEGDPRVDESLCGFAIIDNHLFLTKLYLRKFEPMMIDNKYPVEFRCVFVDGKLKSIANYYIQRKMKDFDIKAKQAVKQIQQHIEPIIKDNIVLDFGYNTQEELFFIDSNPCMFQKTTHPCGFSCDDTISTKEYMRALKNPSNQIMFSNGYLKQT